MVRTGPKSGPNWTARRSELDRRIGKMGAVRTGPRFLCFQKWHTFHAPERKSQFGPLKVVRTGPLRKSWAGERPVPSSDRPPSPGRPRRPTEPRRPGTPLDLGFLDFGFPGGCASSRLDHGSKFYGIRGGCASSRLIHGFPSPNNSQKMCKKSKQYLKTYRSSDSGLGAASASVLALADARWLCTKVL